MKQFDFVQAKKPKRSAFDLSHRRVTTMNPAELTPIFCKEVIPGDTFNFNLELYLKTMPLISPVMHHVNMYAHAFFVPTRLLVGNEAWENFITGKTETNLPSWDPSYYDASPSKLPDLGKNGLAQALNFGVWDGAASNPFLGKPMSQLPLRAYQLIWSEYYRDQNHTPAITFANIPNVLTHGVSDTHQWIFSKRKRCFEKDYFTSAMLTQQRGAPVSMPLSGSAPVIPSSASNELSVIVSDGGAPSGAGNLVSTVDGVLQNDSSGEPVYFDGQVADLSQATATTISDLRQAFALQRWYEASMRFGQRYVEQLLGLFGVVSKDSRLQRPEFLAGGKLPVQIGEVLQTSQSDTTPQGTMAGKALSIGNIINFRRDFDEHGYIMILVSVLPRTSYLSFCDRQNLHLDRFDFPFPQFAHLSEQVIFNQEIYQANEAALVNPFGYQPIYTEHRYIPDTYHGELKDTLKFWGLGREFPSLPSLDEQFVEGSFPQDIFAVDEEQAILLQSFARITAIRPLPKYGTPV